MTGEGGSRVSRRRIAARRGIVLGLLVLCVLIFTSFFREDEGGFLHNLKGTVGAVITPVQEFTSAAVQPVKDGWNWFAELRTARDDAKRLEAENAILRGQIVSDVEDQTNLAELRQQLALADEGAGAYAPVTAKVVGRPQFDISRRAKLGKGTSSGIVVNAPVIAPFRGDSKVFGFLVGRVTSTTSNSATVALITDPSTRIGAKVQGTDKPLGLLKAESSGALLLEQVPSDLLVQKEQVVVTAGYGTLRVPSPYPPGIPIGYVVGVGGREPGEFQTVQVSPFRDPLELNSLTVLTPKSAEAKRRAGG